MADKTEALPGLEVRNLSKSYGKKKVLDSVGFSMEAGEQRGVIGANGQGKSTLLSVLAGIWPADGGEVLLCGRDMLRNGWQRASWVSYVPQASPFSEDMRAIDYALLWYGRRGMERSLEEGELKRLGVGDFLQKPIRQLSGGMRKRLSIGCALASGPKLLCLDEPSAALDLPARLAIREFLEEYTAAGGMVLLASHDMEELAACHSHSLLEGGKMEAWTWDGNVEALLARLSGTQGSKSANV